MKKCPFCAEEIQDEAIKCRYCGEHLNKPAEPQSDRRKLAWYYRTSTLVIGFVFIGPFVLPLVWFHPHYSLTKKLVITGCVLLITFILFKLTIVSMKSIQQSYEILMG